MTIIRVIGMRILVLFVFLSSTCFCQLPDPVAYYDFSGNANDISGNGLHGTVNGAVLTTDRCGNADGAYLFNGSSSYISVDYDPLFNIPVSGEFTISCWVKALDSGVEAIFVKSPNISPWTDSEWDYGIYLITNNLMIGTHVDGWAAVGSELINEATCWKHLAGTYNNGIWKIYVDGVLDAADLSSTKFITASSSAISMGKKGEADGDYYEGKMDDVMFFDVELSADQISDLYESQRVASIISADTAICPGDEVPLYFDVPYCGSFVATDIEWAPEESLSDPNIVAPIASPVVTTTYTVDFEIDGCDYNEATTVELVTLTDVFPDETYLCEGDTILLDAENPGATYLWQDGSTDQTIEVFDPGIYWVEMTLAECVYRDSIEISVVNPTVFLGNDTTLCVPDTLTLISNVLGATYLWQDGSTDSTFEVFETGTYSIQIDSAGCDSRDTIFVEFIDVLVDLGDDIYTCHPEELTLDAENPGSDYLWQDGTTSQFLDVADIGTFFVTVTEPVIGCFDSDTVLVLADDISVDLGNDTLLCFPEMLPLDAENPGASYLWQDGSTDQVLVGDASGVYYVQVTQGICTGSDTIELIVQNPMAAFSASDFTGCAPEEINFINTSTIDGTDPEWNWDFGDGNFSDEEHPSHIFEVSGTYNVQLSFITAEGCISEIAHNVEIVIYPNPIADYTYSPTKPLINEEILFENLSIDFQDLLWDFGDGTFSEEENPSHTYADVGDYFVSLIVNYEECFDTLTRVITITEPLIFYVPNVFTPDGDSFNESFVPIFTAGYDPYDYHLTIFNRWGEIIFESYNTEMGWNGTYGNGPLVEDGVYVWLIQVGDPRTDERYEFVGNVTLVK